MHLGLSQKTAIVTGGTSGIGRSIALALAREGVQVVLLGTSAERGAEVVSAIGAFAHQPATFLPVDISQPVALEQSLTEALAVLGRCDILVNCAGKTHNGLLMRTSEADWDEMIALNLKAIYLTSRFLIRPMLKARAGCILNVSSVVGLVGNAGQCAYSAAKAGVVGFTKSLAREVASRGIRVNCIAPGWVTTRMTENLAIEQKSAASALIPLGRFGESDEIAQAAVFLCSNAASYVTGQVLAVDGGLTM